MTVIKPNAIAGINSITVASGAALAVHKADGTLIQTIAGTSGVSTFSSVSVGSATTTNDAVKSINIGLGASISQHTDNSLTFGTNGDPRITIDASGNFNVGSAATIKAGGNATFSGIVTATAFKGDGSGLSGVTAVTINSNADNRVITGSDSANTLNGESNINIASGILIAGHTASTTTSNGEGPFLQVKGTDSRGGASFMRHSADAAGCGLYIGKSRNATIGSNTVVQANDELGRITFSGDDGTDVHTVGVEIQAHVDGTPGSNDMPGRLTLLTTADGAASPTERLRLTAMGDLTMGNTSGYSIWRGTGNDQFCKFQFRQTTGDNRGFALLEERGDANCMDLFLSKSRGGNGVGAINSGDNLGFIKFAGGDGTRQHNAAAIQVYNSGTVATGRVAGNMSFYTSPDSVSSFQERMRIDAAGDVTVTNGNVIIGTSGKGIDFSATGGPTNGSGTSELLDDYEEGTFTPTARGNNTNSSPVIEGSGKYTKIGNVVQIQLSFANENGSYLPSGEYIQIHGLPFTFNGEHFIPYGFNYKVVFNSTDQYLFYSPSGNTRLDGYINRSDLPYTPWGTDQWDNTQWYHSNSFSYLTS